MIKGRCHSNRDSFKSPGYWPNVFADNIAIGHMVQNCNGDMMKVISITHSTVKQERDGIASFDEPFIIVELTVL